MTKPVHRRAALQTCASAALLGCFPGAQAQPTAAGGGRTAWPAWDAFKAQIINEGGRVVSDDDGGGQTYSEGQSYALFFALVANDRPMFDKLLRWTENNLCEGDMTARLPAWLWGRRPDGSWGVIDSNAASDADLWIAYALGEAGRLWNERSYRALSALLAARVLRAVNSPFYGLPQPVTSIVQAVTYLGLTTVRITCLRYIFIAAFKTTDLRRQQAISSASLTRLVCMCGCMLQPTTWRLCRSSTAARYSHPSSVGM